MSAVYVDATKDRMYCDAQNSLRRRASPDRDVRCLQSRWRSCSRRSSSTPLTKRGSMRASPKERARAGLPRTGCGFRFRRGDGRVNRCSRSSLSSRPRSRRVSRPRPSPEQRSFGDLAVPDGEPY
ncbi:MAG: hypothetical protein QM755_13075 [Luteolibacter sp.]